MRLTPIYWFVIGLVFLLVGGIELAVGVLGTEWTFAGISVSGTYLPWRGVIVAAAGAIYVRGVLADLQQTRAQAVILLASLMLWIVAGHALLATILGTLPGGEDVWIASASQLLVALGPPYPPSLALLPVTLPALLYPDIDWPVVGSLSVKQS